MPRPRAGLFFLICYRLVRLEGLRGGTGLSGLKGGGRPHAAAWWKGEVPSLSDEVRIFENATLIAVHAVRFVQFGSIIKLT